MQAKQLDNQPVSYRGAEYKINDNPDSNNDPPTISFDDDDNILWD
ncbi:hypothetical protein [Spiroplasma endosymbiont of Ammophila pubescens]